MSGLNCTVLPKNAVIKSATISQTPRGNCDVSVLVECAASIQPVEPTTETVLGLDYSSPSLYVDSEGTPANYPQCYRQAEAQLKKAQRQLSHRKKGGQNREKQRLTVAKLHEKVAHCGAELDRDENAAIDITNKADTGYSLIRHQEPWGTRGELGHYAGVSGHVPKSPASQCERRGGSMAHGD